LILPECSAAIARPTGKPELAEQLVALIESIPGLQLVSLDALLAHRAAQIAASHRLRGADSIYVAVAETYSATLITWDAEMLTRASAVVPAVTPTDWIAQRKSEG
jgi:predicted nucleic acid-binding protein